MLIENFVSRFCLTGVIRVTENPLESTGHRYGFQLFEVSISIFMAYLTLANDLQENFVTCLPN